MNDTAIMFWSSWKQDLIWGAVEDCWQHQPYFLSYWTTTQLLLHYTMQVPAYFTTSANDAWFSSHCFSVADKCAVLFKKPFSFHWMTGNTEQSSFSSLLTITYPCFLFHFIVYFLGTLGVPGFPVKWMISAFLCLVLWNNVSYRTRLKRV